MQGGASVRKIVATFSRMYLAGSRGCMQLHRRHLSAQFAFAHNILFGQRHILDDTIS